MNIKKYFWSLNSKAIRETKKILKDPDHPEFVKKMVAILSRCDKPKEVFSLISKEKFTEVWPKIKRYWMKTNQSPEFRAWWETVYEELVGIRRKKMAGEPSIFVAEIGKIIKNYRIEKGISQSDLSKRSGIVQPDISAIEKGKKNITIETLLRLCKVLGIKDIPVK
jgi:ribosome-binding protein aMBF1 (putative translation factor)